MQRVLCLVHSPMVLLAFIVMFPSSSGCSKTAQPPDFGTSEGHDIAWLITEDLQENVARKSVLENRIFVKGGAPSGANFEKFSKCEFDIVGKPTVNGKDATAKIAVHDPVANQKLGVIEWSFTQETAGGKSVWKIKSAPLP